MRAQTDVYCRLWLKMLCVMWILRWWPISVIYIQIRKVPQKVISDFIDCFYVVAVSYVKQSVKPETWLFRNDTYTFTVTLLRGWSHTKIIINRIVWYFAVQEYLCIFKTGDFDFQLNWCIKFSFMDWKKILLLQLLLQLFKNRLL